MLISFLGSHLVASCKEMNHEFFFDLNNVLKEGIYSVPSSEINELHKVIHYNSQSYSPVLGKTALNYANENDDKIIAWELLKYEKCFHPNRNCFLKCLQDNLSMVPLLPWMIETSKELFPGGKHYTLSVLLVMFNMFCSYIPFLYDYYSDITLTFDYYSIAYASDNSNQELFGTCNSSIFSTDLDFECLKKTSFHGFNFYFEIAYLVTTATLMITIGFYVIIIYSHSKPDWLVKLENEIKKKCLVLNLSRPWTTILLMMVKLPLAFLVKLFFPIQHMINEFRYRQAKQRTAHRDKASESHRTWKCIKSFENGLEGSVQLYLQMWLLKPFFNDLARWRTYDLVQRSLFGIFSFLTFDQITACYIERALGKILLTILSMSLSGALMKSTKPGIGACESPLRILPILLSILAQTTARMFAIRSLIILDTFLQLNKYAVFFTVHFLFVFFITILSEIKEKYSTCSVFLGRKLDLLKMLKFFFSLFSSSIIMVHLKEDEISFLPHCSFFILILCENLVLTSLPLIEPSLYPEHSCFPFESHKNGMCWVIALWIIGVGFQVGVSMMLGTFLKEALFQQASFQV